jgi:hypothetical protein
VSVLGLQQQEGVIVYSEEVRENMNGMEAVSSESASRCFIKSTFIMLSYNFQSSAFVYA